MKCPICEKKIEVKSIDLTQGKNDKKYNRTIYNCEECDSWISVEVPIGNDEE